VRLKDQRGKAFFPQVADKIVSHGGFLLFRGSRLIHGLSALFSKTADCGFVCDCNALRQLSYTDLQSAA